MRLKLSILLFLFCSLTVCALDFRVADGESAFLCVNGTDTLLICAGEPHLQSTVGSVDWYYTDGALIQTNTDEVWPESGRGVRVEHNGVTSAAYVFDYRDYLPTWTTVTVEPHCASTVLRVDGTVPPITYTRPTGSATYPHAIGVRYTDLMWGGTEWVDSLVSVTSDKNSMPLFAQSNEVRIDPFYGSGTVFTLFDSLSVALGLADSIHSEAVEPIAVKCHITSETTTRPDDPAGLNEPKRPISSDVLTGSGPLDILFHLNPTPAVEYYSWDITQSTTAIAHRMDESTRYTFYEPGSYNIHGRVWGNVCPCSTEDDCDLDSTHYTGDLVVTISESYLKVPNVFTPNGDGRNDEFRVAYQSLREFHCWIYNRWGHLVYSWDDPAKGWDGMIGGRPAAEGAYMYVIRALGTDAAKGASYGTKMGYKKKIKQQDESILGVYRLSGTVNLIRGKK